MVRWRPRGEERLATIDVRRFDGQTIVVHFGGHLTSVDAYTFGNSLIAFADTVRCVNAQINPDQRIEVRLEAVGPGSFKAVIKYVKKGIIGLFASVPQNIFWIIATIYIENSLDGPSVIEIADDAVVIIRGEEKIILPSMEAFEQYEKAKSCVDVQKNIAKTFRCIEYDEAIENFGISPDIADEEPLVQIPRSDFDALVKLPDTLNDDQEKRRPRMHQAVLVILKPWINASDRKWTFEWNGVPITAYVRDEVFLDRVRSHEIGFRNGDAIKVDLEVNEELDEDRDLWISDTSSYVVREVHTFIPIARQGEKLL